MYLIFSVQLLVLAKSDRKSTKFFPRFPFAYEKYVHGFLNAFFVYVLPAPASTTQFATRQDVELPNGPMNGGTFVSDGLMVKAAPKTAAFSGAGVSLKAAQVSSNLV